MTSAMLKRVYWPAWGAAFRACWQTDRGTVSGLKLREEPADASLPGPREVESIAERLRGCSRLTADHLRHACHVRALGRDKSATTLTAQEMDRVVVLFDLLANPLSIDAVNRWCNPDLDARRRLEWRVNNSGMTPAYVATVCRDRFGSANWKGLTTAQLRQLVVTLDQRARARARKTEAPHAY
jgi:hypothetical protein